MIPVAVAALESDIEMFNTIAPDIVEVHYSTTKELSTESLKSIMSILCYPAFMNSTIEKHGLRTQMIQVYMSGFMSLGLIPNKNKINIMLDEYNIIYQPTPHNNLFGVIDRLKTSIPDFARYWASKKSEFNLYDSGYDLLSIVTFTSLLFMTKVYNEAGFPKFIENRYRAFSASVGRLGLFDFAKGIGLSGKQCDGIYQVMNSSHSFRKYMFYNLISISKKKNKFGNIMILANRTIELLAWSEMTHITMIDSCLLNMFPEVIGHSAFRSQTPALMRAIDYLLSLPESERPYAKILYSPDQTGLLNRRSLTHWTELALEIFRKISPSAAFFVSAPAKNSLGLNSVILRYIDMRTGHYGLSIVSTSLARYKEEEYAEAITRLTADASNHNQIQTLAEAE